ncbi:MULTISPECIES: CerR family C-terminal domain-containing protein [unclassified Mesorhizobium]|uniref:CerR family C-terminal domain-containing protein n=1 Tax=unclassified Mesorhizobium TaxID=325217 RepID=UPI0003CE9961|nr:MULTISPECIES: CerR family C-terminal domain-containing protein [unclassified Mesorhizobium]ESY51259.1 TetR family transcriptional regulator [Mesorhizobium sp. LNJC374B00]ESY56785.1 TetR family transcriptional regulator [Mesorhizobium sp. LNJC372A00]WJI82084.1 CerR family C-terminal domain-containing protein [Mesorhizobium sp. C374B]WJI88603.1 CerR family C-terminal domain-containing protein [Mesorhizobium sp. C372A]
MIKSAPDKMPRQETSPAEQTRAALVLAALKLFGRQGFDGTSTREIAAEAKANIGSIAYHFGGKEGLRAAAADHIVETIQAVAGQALGGMQLQGQASPEAARAQLSTALERMVGFIVARPEAGEIVQFVLRELSHPTAALDRIYDGVFEPTHRRLCQIWEQATGEPAESEATKLVVFTLIGQVIYFRIGREAVMRRMGWREIGNTEAAKVVAAVTSNLGAILAARNPVARKESKR